MKRAAALVSLACAAGGALAAAPANAPASVVAAPAAGCVRAALDARTMLFGGAEGRFAVLDGAGRPVPYALQRPPAGWIAARVVGVAEDAAWRRLTLDVGTAPARHARASLEFAQPMIAAGCRVEGSDDLRTWTPLGAGDLFRLGDGDGLNKSTLSYAPTTARYLRIAVPRVAGFPELRGAAVEAIPFDVADRPAAPVAAAARAGFADSAYLDLGDGAAAPATLELEGARGGRLYLVERGRFRPLGDVAGASGAVGVPAGARLLRFDGPDAARVKGRLRFEPRWILFEAAAASRPYTIVPAAVAASEDAPALDPATCQGTIAAAGAVAPGEVPWPTPPASATRLAAFAKPPRPRDAWPIASAARPGEVALLPLPAELLAPLGRSRRDLLVLAGDRLVPAERSEADAPSAVGAAATVSAGGKAESLPLGDDRTLIAQLELTAPAGSSGTAEVRYREEARLGAPTGRSFAGGASWRCGASPCAAFVDLDPPPGTAAIEVAAQGDGAPVLSARLWRRDDAMLFVWPAEGNVRLASGLERPPSGAADSSAARRALAGRPTVAATLDLAPSKRAAESGARVGRLALVAALALAGAALLVVLLRAMRKTS